MGVTGLENSIMSLVQQFAGDGRTLDVRRAAFGLWTCYPDSPLTIDEIAERLKDAAARSGASFLDLREARH